jgi:hypothetical protein
MNPGVIAPSHIPRMKRTANKPPKLLQAAWHNKAMDQMKMLMLVWRSALEQFNRLSNEPHPFPDRPPLESQVLRVLEGEV